ncbi:ribonuclease MC-like [Cucurbita moschata]|uniref:Ribonuclease MC-like n=1 Tax=Cucurbita moschata TaxID=3662 RepID=A0A6J1EXD5_CUCMO|nr:ribonuclease MC-like [Cucurbita moschata]
MAQAPFIVSIFKFVLLTSCVKAQFDYFQMVQQWPPATCSGVRCYANPPAMFTIHGLWPSNYSNVPLVCAGQPFNPAQIATLVPQLNTYWPDVISGNNQRFWKHEWDSHGTCSDPPFNQLQYFQTTLNIRTNHNYDLLAILNTAGLGPTATNTRQYGAIEGAIQAATGKKPGLRCNKNAQSKKKQLFEIILCFDKNGVTLIDCTQFAGITCPSQFVWLHRPPLSLVSAVGELKNSLVHQVSILKFLFLCILLSVTIMFRKRFYGTRRGGGKQE